MLTAVLDALRLLLPLVPYAAIIELLQHHPEAPPQAVIDAADKAIDALEDQKFGPK